MTIPPATYQPGHDGLTIKQVKRLIWEALGGKYDPQGRHIPNAMISTRIHMAKIQIDWPHVFEHTKAGTVSRWLEGSTFKYAELLKYVQRLNEPVTIKHIAEKYDMPALLLTTPPPIIATPEQRKIFRDRYIEANRQYVEREFPAFYSAKGWFKPTYPKVETANGMKELVVKYLTWMGHFSNRTNNMGTPRVKKVPKYNIFTEQVEEIVTGVDWTTSHSKKGMQDIDCNLKHSKHPFGIPWKIEIKVGRDKSSTAQKRFAPKVKKSGAIYSVIRTDAEFFNQYDELLKDSI